MEWPDVSPGAETARLFSPYGGSCTRLSGGQSGMRAKGGPRNGPPAWGYVVGVFSSGSTILEVDPAGTVVQKMKFSQGPAPLEPGLGVVTNANLG